MIILQVIVHIILEVTMASLINIKTARRYPRRCDLWSLRI